MTRLVDASRLAGSAPSGSSRSAQVDGLLVLAYSFTWTETISGVHLDFLNLEHPKHGLAFDSSNPIVLFTLATILPAGSKPSLIFVHRNTKPNNVLILLQGNVKLSMDSEDGRTLIFRIAEPQEILGLSSVIAGEAYDKNSTAPTLCRLASVTISDFDCLLRRSAQTLILALSELNNSYKQACTQIQMLGEPISVRLARAILQWSRHGQRTERGPRFHIPLNHAEIGEYIGARREAVTRMLGEFHRRGFIDIKGALLTVMDRHRLETSAGLPHFGSHELA